MPLLLDTNILLFCINDIAFDDWFDKNYRLPSNDLIISVVTEGELRSLAIQRGWGKRKMEVLDTSIKKMLIYPIKVDASIRTDRRLQSGEASRPTFTAWHFRSKYGEK